MKILPKKTVVCRLATDRHTDRQTDRQTHTQTDRQTDTQTDRQNRLHDSCQSRLATIISNEYTLSSQMEVRTNYNENIPCQQVLIYTVMVLKSDPININYLYGTNQLLVNSAEKRNVPTRVQIN